MKSLKMRNIGDKIMAKIDEAGQIAPTWLVRLLDYYWKLDDYDKMDDVYNITCYWAKKTQ